MLLTCAAAIIINMTSTPINQKVLTRAHKVCRIKYKSCLGKFIKKEEQVYHVICKGDK